MADPQRAREVHPLKRRLAGAALALLLTLGVAELWARSQEQSVRLVDDGRYYAEWPGKHGTNDDGFLEREAPLPPGRRIAVLGDSMTWGTGTAEQSWPRVAEAALGPPWQVLNFSTYGYDTAQERATLPYALQVRPEAIVVALYTNDAYPTRYVELAGRPVFVGRGRAPFALLRLAQGAVAARRLPKENWDAFERELRGIIADAAPTPVYAVGLRPHTLTGGPEGCAAEVPDVVWCRDQARMAERQRAIVASIGLPWLPLALRDTGATAFWPPGHQDREHPNVEGAAAIGKAFAVAWAARSPQPVSPP